MVIPKQLSCKITGSLDTVYQCFFLNRTFFLWINFVLLFFYFPDLQLDVKGCKDVYASFDKYVEVERLEGDNKYHAEQHGLQVCFFHSNYCTYQLRIYIWFNESKFSCLCKSNSCVSFVVNWITYMQFDLLQVSQFHRYIGKSKLHYTIYAFTQQPKNGKLDYFLFF